MRTAVTETSRDTYRAIRSEGVLSRREAELMAMIKPKRDYSLMEIAEALDWQVSTVSARVNALIASDHLVRPPGYTRKCSITARTIHPVRLPIVQRDLFS